MMMSRKISRREQTLSYRKRALKPWRYMQGQQSLTLQSPVCIPPYFNRLIMPHQSTNTAKEEHKDMIIHLIQVTEDCIRKFDVSVLLRDLAKYITKIHDYPTARGGFGEIWKCMHITDQGPVTVSF